MSQQPEALKHAEWLERSLTIGAPEAAAELRRLHALKVRHIDLIDGLVAQRDTLRTQVARLQAAGQVGDEVGKFYQSEGLLPGYGYSIRAGTKEQPEPAPVAAVTAMVPLTDEQAKQVLWRAHKAWGSGPKHSTPYALLVIRETEAHHGIGLTVGGSKASGRVGK